MRVPVSSVVIAVTFATWAEAFAAVSISKTNYHGWPDSYVIGNGKVEVVVVPAVGRVMQFRFAGEAEGPFWENRQLDGKPVDPKSKDWVNFGGDKSWPAPQADWPKVTPRGWPPPVAFDSMPVEAVVEGGKLRLKSAVDPHYGVRAERIIALDAASARMTIETTYFKVEGAPRAVSVWIITQLADPEFVHVPTAMGDKFVRQSTDLPQDLKVGKSAITLTRSKTRSTKIGTDSSSLWWIGKNFAARIDSPRFPHGDYPDNDSSAEVYTNPDPLAYVELEMLGPLKTLNVGESLSQTNTYSLYTRKEADAIISAPAK